MGLKVCVCDGDNSGHMGRPNCVIPQGVLAFPMLESSIGSTGLENFLPVDADGITAFNAQYGTSATTLKQCVDYRLSALAPALDGLFPLLKVETVAPTRTDTNYVTAGSGRKVEIGGGGITTFAMELWHDDAVHAIGRELLKAGCGSLNFIYVSVDGHAWGIKDSDEAVTLRGYNISDGTFKTFMEFATDSTTNMIKISWDIDEFECLENAYVITSNEYEGKWTSIRPLIAGKVSHDAAASTLVAASPIIISIDLYDSFGTAGNRHDITGSLTGDFELLDDVGGVQEAAGAWASVVESPDGTYLLTTTSSPAAGTFTLTSKSVGYIIPNINIVVA